LVDDRGEVGSSPCGGGRRLSRIFRRGDRGGSLHVGMPGSRPDQKSSAACQQAIQENPDSATHIDVYRIRLNWSIFLSLTRGEIGGRSGGGRLDDINSAF